MPRADELEHGDRIRLPYTDEIVEVESIDVHFNRVTVNYRHAIRRFPGQYTVHPHHEFEDCS